MSFLHFFNNYKRIIVHWNHCRTQTIFSGFSSPPLVRSFLQPQSYDLNRGNTEGPHRCISDAWHKFDMVWLYCSLIPVGRRGVFYSFKWFLPAFAALEECGWGGQHPVSPAQYIRVPFLSFFSVSYIVSWPGPRGNDNEGISFSKDEI